MSIKPPFFAATSVPISMKPLIVAHSGGRTGAPEGTLPAFERAIQRGADTIEFDIHQTKDDKIVFTLKIS